MNPRRTTLARWDELPLEKITEMVARKAVSSADATLTQAYYKKGVIVPRHAAPGDLIVHVLQGALRVSLDAEELTIREGDVLVIPAGVDRQVECLDDTFVLIVSRREA